eukprot:CAMPEP_0178403390 /NCGR_PEP_ID=MMETSP0689_2-20121128/17342_1 /TAXON_ID=160604 /ORGANISM="Amphidinium massartii, Strain CS-259" /LENGTH=280 /DNA_ID=CAMNT_0020024339 /DNA_START=38 /DNA_END=880 /DNA_ORIENTATION=-
MARTLAEAKERYESACKKRDAKSKGTKGKSSQKSRVTMPSPGSAAEGGAAASVLRTRPGMRALREIRHYQESTELLFPKVAFQRLVRQIVKKLGPYRFEVQALVALQEAGEDFLTGLFEDASLMTLHANRVTVMLRDLKLAQRMRSDKKAAGAEAAAGAATAKNRVKVEPAEEGGADAAGAPSGTSATGPAAAAPSVSEAPMGETSATVPPTVPATVEDVTEGARDLDDDDDDEENDPDYVDSDAEEDDRSDADAAGDDDAGMEATEVDVSMTAAEDGAV